LYVLLITLGFLVYQSCLSLFFTELLFLQISFGFLVCLFLDAFLQSFAYIKKKKKQIDFISILLTEMLICAFTK
jgi:multisubunit Na+/H+ antiporter MnhE subunit